MALSVVDGNGVKQVLSNAGDNANVYSACSNGTITASNTSATDVFQFVGAANIVARIRRIELFAASVVATGTITLAAAATLVRLIRRTAAGTTGTWTALANGTGVTPHNLNSAAASCTVNVAGTTAFTIGAGTGQLRQGYLYYPAVNGTTDLVNPSWTQTSLVWEFGTRGSAPLYVIGASDFLVINLNGVTPVGTIGLNIEWDEQAPVANSSPAQ